MSIYRILNAKLQADYQDFPIFGLLLYSDQDSNGHMEIVLSNSSYLERISIRSGSRWNIYCLKLLTRLARPAERPAVDSLSMLTTLPSLQLEESPGNEEIMGWFSIRFHSELPCLVIFTFDQDTKDLLSVKQYIRGKNPADTFNDLHEIVSDVAAALGEIKKEHLANRAEIFHQIKERLAGKREIEIVKKFIDFADARGLLRRAAWLTFGS